MTASFYFCGTFPARQMRVISRWSSTKTVRSCRSPSFSSSTGRPSGPTVFALAIAFIAVAISSSVSSISRALTTGCCGVSLGCPDLACWIPRQQRAEEPYPSLADTSSVPQQSPFFPRHGRIAIRHSSSPLTAHIFDVLEESMLVSHA